MNIVVYCGASKGISKIYEQAAKQMGKWIAQNNHTLVYGGGKMGLMGVIADEVLKNGGKVIGIIPQFLVDREVSHPHLSELEIVESMSERKNRMVELGQCFIALPGGPGTLEEITEVFSWARIARHNHPSILWNVDGYYEKLYEFLKHMTAQGFLLEHELQAIQLLCDFDQLETYINQYKGLAFRTYD
jgi:uncharacterized protein (TIGR00730 family)